ncbi:dioxygenase [Mycolicibacterium smegmatis]|uniref:Hydroxyquinol 1,2-dioxygenase n=1 Tax=Mycolicibacterium smegmatis (strain MKD8) TaxID=1214915 RepID=A0A2U9PT93_MYCSE|nr:dioxygenase [Mycolicibacterium smegmatis]AWT54996.1 hydroxyquinol 1,2-dioxygenase [Mycolicibacterium smegmatis MKD8]
MDITPDESAAVVAASFDNTPDPRLKEAMQSAVRHLHDFVREVRPTNAEWELAIDFLTRTGQACSETRQEFILLSDILGVSMLVETLNDAGGRLPEGDGLPVTATTVLGPFHMTTSPTRRLGENIDVVGSGMPCVVKGRVTDVSGNPIPGAKLDVWHANEEGFYDVEQPDKQPAGNGRGIFTTDEDGSYWFRTVTPRHYPIPTDGPAGGLVVQAGRAPYRPAHLHFIAEADGYEAVTTHVFMSKSPYIDSDVVFAVKSSLIRDFVEIEDEHQAADYGVRAPFRLVQFDLALAHAE